MVNRRATTLGRTRILAIFHSAGLSDSYGVMTAMFALNHSSPTALSAAVRYYLSAVETG
jgi:hypothetical protein